ncbi:MAG: D-alanine--D-alanine ligase [Phycisphaerales bacterium]|nr:D-alanine--D-alanine ligase [Phycisphaerales bacterium]
MTKVLVLMGGPDAEHEVSVQSGAGVAGALRASERVEVIERVIREMDLPSLRALPGEVIFPVLHGPFGEGGPMQDLLEADGRPFVGCRAPAARLGMDKLATKVLAATLGVPVLTAAVLNPGDTVCPIGLPAVIKPVHEGSSVGLHLCRDAQSWEGAIRDVFSEGRGAHRANMVERMASGRELTLGLLDGSALPLIEIIPASGVYDYEAKYTRDDTRYVVNPVLPLGVGERIARHGQMLSRAIGVRHLARVDFLLDGAGTAWCLEVNTLPGFTSHSLFPMAAAAVGLRMPDLCVRLVELALRDASRR